MRVCVCLCLAATAAGFAPRPCFSRTKVSGSCSYGGDGGPLQSAIADSGAALRRVENDDSTDSLPIAKDVVAEAAVRLQPTFAEIDRHTQSMLRRVLDTFRCHQVGSSMFAGVDGYGHGDIGRDTLDAVYAELLGAEAALVRVQCFSGTHAIACALFGALRPGDTLLACSGAPYDTLDEVIGTRAPLTDAFDATGEDPLPPGLIGNLAEFGISYSQVPLTEHCAFDLDAIDAAIAADPAVKVLHVQRSCGYQWRKSLPIAEIERFCTHIRTRWLTRPDLVIFVDNCYGEFVEDREPPMVGADLIAGSLIKNPGGTIARSGGYIAGKKALVRAAANRLAAPGVAGGATLGQNRNLYQGLFMASGVVGESLKGANLVAEVLGNGYQLPTNPAPGAARTDIIQAVQLGTRERTVAFCKVVQKLSPVNAYYRPEPGKTPGYGDEVIFADGTFTDGSTLELSADGPLREPYAVYAQGCTHWTHWAIILEEALVQMGLARAE
ncbi:aluminum resistance protein [Tribonema minus]|uniref:Aluminum resistance protein n=1 Tax=Tribonema minus TaxID=303371 RepID=A0A835ZAS5_9STRA|nr:aluminum resistance protein [Tribonema minus]